MALLLELIEQVAEAAAEHAAGRTTREQAAEAALEDIAETAAAELPPGRPAVTLPGNLGGAWVGAAPGWLPPKCLTAFQASSARIAIVIGDIPLLSLGSLGALGPRGPFCMPLSTSSKPIVVSSSHNHHSAPVRET